MNVSLPDFALRRPVTVIMLTITLAGLGIIAWQRLPLSFLPRTESPFLLCVFPWPGAAPAQVEQQIAIPVEGEFRTISGLSRIETTSHGGGCQVSMLFRQDADMSAVTGEIRDRIERLKLTLPEDMDNVVLQRFNMDSFPVMALGMFHPGDREEFAHLARTVAEPRLRRIEGVANVEVHAPTAPREALVEFEQDTLRSLNIALADILTVLRDGAMNLSLGNLDDGDARYFVRYTGEYTSLDDIARIVVGADGLRLRDVARVRYSAREEPMRVALDGADGLLVLITKESQANTVEVCRAVRNELDAIMGLPGFEEARVEVLFDQSTYIVSALSGLFRQGLFGGAMAVFVLLLFLRRLAPTVLVALAIPASLLFAVVFLYATAMSLNIVTMVSMIVAVGMLVDNAIVVVENILRRRALGDSVRVAVIRGANEVGLAIFASTVTTWVVFLPMFYMQSGQMSVFMQQLAGPLVVALGGSLVVALTLAPLALGVLEQFSERRARRRTQREGIRFFTHLLDGYAGLLSISLRHKALFLALLLAAIFVSWRYPMRAVGMRALPQLDMRQMSIDVTLAPNYGMEGAEELFARIEREINEHRDALGIRYVFLYHSAEGGSVQVFLREEEEGRGGGFFHRSADRSWYTTEEVMQILSQKLPSRLPGAELRFISADVGDPGAERGVSVQIRGDDAATLEQYARHMADAMDAVASLRDVTIQTERAREEVQLHIDEPLARRAGVSPLRVAQTVDAALRGVRLPWLKRGGREIPVWAQFREEDRQSRANLETIAMADGANALAPLHQMTDFRMAPAPGMIRRVNGRNVAVVTAQTRVANLMAVKQELRGALNAIELPPTYSWTYGDEIGELDENLFTFVYTFLMAIVLIYLVLCALFESLLLPFSIMATMPLAFIGAVWLLFFTNTPFDAISLIGCVLMAGIIVNNGIVIVDHIQGVRAGMAGDDCVPAEADKHCLSEVMARDAAIVRAGRDRFRPVLMTATTTVLGLVPVALASAGGAATFSGLARTLIGGLCFGTVLTLFVVPVAYATLDDISRFTRDFLGDVALRMRP